MAIDLASDIKYLKSLRAVRERSRIVLEAARNGGLNNFVYDEGRMRETAEYVVGVISRDFGPDRYTEIPPHGRWEHFSIGGILRLENLVQQWQASEVDRVEITRRLIDLFFVSVLLDAGAGDSWSFREPGSDKSYGRSEGIAVATLYMFTDGTFSSAIDGNKAAVDGQALSRLTEDTLIHHFQVGPQNPIRFLVKLVVLACSVFSFPHGQQTVHGSMDSPLGTHGLSVCSMIGLYRNGGLFVDMGVLRLKPDVLSKGVEASGQTLPLFSSTADVVVEWRALTVALLDELHKLVNDILSPQGC
ncbi:hypothetical protein Trco_004628 [Trichoderma cornu-damae]|uniref:Protein urg3 n=1 Tax=Trichoderma cornu-damae TaxID=654480 RepID=A0A9P8QL59_9HYPO|nr:hypothetical protein Trco_004628 [Trichoderma cornu-damae]